MKLVDFFWLINEKISPDNDLDILARGRRPWSELVISSNLDISFAKCKTTEFTGLI